MHRILVAALAACTLLAGPAWAQNDGWGRNSDYNKKFDPKAMVTVQGKVTKIDRQARPLPGMAQGFAATIQTDQGEEVVQVGPIWFTSYFKQKWDVKPGDAVEVTGSRVKIGNKPIIMAVQGKKDNLVMTCRSKSGKPVWDLEIEDFSIP